MEHNEQPQQAEADVTPSKSSNKSLLLLLGVAVAMFFAFDRWLPASPIPQFTNQATGAFGDEKSNPIGKAAGFPEVKVNNEAKPRSLLLSDKNTVVLRNEVSAESVTKIQQELILKSAKLPKNSPIYLVLDTPGGSVTDGEHLISTAKGLPNQINTITIFAASMGFHIVQSLGDRLAIPSATLMQHRAAVNGVGGEINGNFNTRANYLINSINELEALAAKRMGCSLEKYQDTIRGEYWANAQRSLREGVIDEIVTIRCDESLMDTRVEHMSVLIFDLEITYSKCPAITGPLEVKINVNQEARKLRGLTDYEVEIKKEEVRKFVFKVLNDRAAFVRFLQNNSKDMTLKGVEWTK